MLKNSIQSFPDYESSSLGTSTEVLTLIWLYEPATYNNVYYEVSLLNYSVVVLAYCNWLQ